MAIEQRRPIKRALSCGCIYDPAHGRDKYFVDVQGDCQVLADAWASDPTPENEEAFRQNASRHREEIDRHPEWK